MYVAGFKPHAFACKPDAYTSTVVPLTAAELFRDHLETGGESFLSKTERDWFRTFEPGNQDSDGRLFMHSSAEMDRGFSGL